MSIRIDPILGIIGTIRPKDIVPQHRVLSIVALWDPVVHIVCFGIKDFPSPDRHDHVVARVIQAREKASHGQETKGCGQMNLQEPSAEKEGPQVIVLAQEEFERVYVDGIDIRATRSLLVMVMFVNVAVDAFNVQEPV